MDNRELDFAALERCLQSLGHLFIDIGRLTDEPEYEEKRGGYGDVRVATLDSGTSKSRLVAAKTIRLKTRHKEPQRLAFRLARELKVWAGLQHQHVLPLSGYYLDKNYKTAVLISEYMIHGDLKEFIEQERPSWDLRLQLIRDSTDALAYLHAQSPPIRHGDLKTGNILINAEQQAMLADFGLSRALEEGATGLTTSDGVKGTLRYYSPELVSDPPADRGLPSDIWAWACLALEALTDELPYATKTTDPSLFMAIMMGELPSDPESLPIPVPDLKILIAKCWTIKPNERPSAADCLRILNSVLLASQISTAIERISVQEKFTQPEFRPTDSIMYNILKKATRFVKRILNPQTGHANVFIIICLCYEGLEWPEGGSMELEGPKNDLPLLLRNLRYRHRNEDRQFLIFTDFEVSFQDHTGFSDTVATIRATHDNLASRVPDTMRDLDREDKCAIYFSGHIDSPQAGQGSARIVLRDDEGIYDHELRGWLNHSRYPTTTIVAIFDACHSGGFLDLPYAHTKGDRSISTINGTYGEQMNSQVVEIFSSSRDQLSFSEEYTGEDESETTHTACPEPGVLLEVDRSSV